MSDHDDVFLQSFGARCANVIKSEHFQHGGAHVPAIPGNADDREGNHWQDHVQGDLPGRAPYLWVEHADSGEVWQAPFFEIDAEQVHEQ